MGRFFITTYLTWHEPEPIRPSRRLAARGRFSFRQATVLAMLTAGTLVLAHLINPNVTSLPLPAALPVGLAFGYGSVYLMVWICQRGASQMRITDRGIVQHASAYKLWRYDRIDRCEIARRDCDGELIAVLLLHLKNGRTRTFGIDPEFSREELTRVITERGVPVERSQ